MALWRIGAAVYFEGVLLSTGRLTGGLFDRLFFRAIARGVPKVTVRRGPGAPESSSRRGRERGISSIDTAIVMISLIVVGAVTASALLNVGLFGAEETKVASFGAIEKIQGALVIRGGASAIRGSVDVDGDDVIVISPGSVDQNAVVTVKFLVTGSAPESVVDLTPPYTFDSAGTDPDASGLSPGSIMSFTTEDVIVTEAAWTVAFIGTNDGDYLLEDGEKAEITLWLQSQDIVNNLWDLGAGAGDPFLDLATELLQTDTLFEIGLDVGAGVITLGRTTPGSLDPIVFLE